MKKISELNKNIILKQMIIGFIINISVSVLFLLIFSVVTYILDSGFDYSSVYGTLRVAAGILVSSFYISRKIMKKGFIIGLLNGTFIFIIVTIISLITDKGGLTVNTLFHLIIFILSSVIGGVLGVNRQKKEKYI